MTELKNQDVGNEKLLQRMQTPDGTILTSRYTHDYVSHVDKNGDTYILDGGLSYLRCSVNKEPMIDVSLYTTTPHSTIREFLTWGSYGRDGCDPLTFYPIKDLSTEHIEAILITQALKPCLKKVFENELLYRKESSLK